MLAWFWERRWASARLALAQMLGVSAEAPLTGTFEGWSAELRLTTHFWGQCSIRVRLASPLPKKKRGPAVEQRVRAWPEDAPAQVAQALRSLATILEARRSPLNVLVEGTATERAHVLRRLLAEGGPNAELAALRALADPAPALVLAAAEYLQAWDQVARLWARPDLPAGAFWRSLVRLQRGDSAIWARLVAATIKEAPAWHERVLAVIGERVLRVDHWSTDHQVITSILEVAGVEVDQALQAALRLHGPARRGAAAMLVQRGRWAWWSKDHAHGTTGRERQFWLGLAARAPAGQGALSLAQDEAQGALSEAPSAGALTLRDP